MPQAVGRRFSDGEVVAKHKAQICVNCGCSPLLRPCGAARDRIRDRDRPPPLRLCVMGGCLPVVLRLGTHALLEAPKPCESGRSGSGASSSSTTLRAAVT